MELKFCSSPQVRQSEEPHNQPIERTSGAAAHRQQRWLQETVRMNTISVGRRKLLG